MATAWPPDQKHLLIARKNGSSSSRRQRTFAGGPLTARAIERWEAEGFNTFWVYGPRDDPDGDRAFIGQWNSGDLPEYIEQIKAELKGIEP